jgi:hypothetical protein
MGFRSLQHIQARRSTSRGLYLPATFRLQGLATLLTACSLQALAGFVSHRQRSWDSPFGASSSRKVSGTFPSGSTHLPFHLQVYPVRSTGPARQATVPGLLPFQESLATRTCLAPEPLAAPLGFALLGCVTKALIGVSPDLLPRAWAFWTRTSEFRSAPASPRPISRIAPQAQARQPF